MIRVLCIIIIYNDILSTWLTYVVRFLNVLSSTLFFLLVCERFFPVPTAVNIALLSLYFMVISTKNNLNSLLVASVFAVLALAVYNTYYDLSNFFILPGIFHVLLYFFLVLIITKFCRTAELCLWFHHYDLICHVL